MRKTTLLISLLLFLSTHLYSQPVTWDSSTSYSTGALVIVGTSTYIATTSVPANNTPPNTTYWTDLSVAAAALKIPEEEVPDLAASVILTSLPKQTQISLGSGSVTGDTVSLTIDTETFTYQVVTGDTNATIISALIDKAKVKFPNLSVQDQKNGSATIVMSDAELKTTNLSIDIKNTLVTPPTSNSSTGGGSTSKIINISTNGYSYQGAQKMSAGFIISGTEDLKVYIKAEKSQEAGITPLSNPKLEIWNPSRTNKLYENDNWGTNSNISEIEALGGSYPPIESTDAALLVTLSPGAYFADVFGAAGNSGKALVAVNDVDSSSSSKLINISTNAYAYQGAQKMSAGFIITGTEVVKVYIKAEKSQEPGITPLSNPKLEIWNPSRTSKLYENDNWGTNSNVSEIEALGGSYPPIESTDAALLVTLSPGAYFADVFGVAGNSGKAIVAVNLVE